MKGTCTLFCAAALAACAAVAEYPQDVVWTTPGAGSQDSMPLGNGRIGLNAWTEEAGALCFYIAHGGAWSENMRLLKLGRVRVTFEPNPFADDAPFEQRLETRAGRLRVTAGAAEEQVRVTLWADANYPAVRFHCESGRDVAMRVAVESWRTEPRPLREAELHSAYGLANSGKPVVVEPDTFAEAKGLVFWYHRNARSIWADTLRRQGLEEWAERAENPLLHRTFGGLLRGDGLHSAGKRALATEPAREHTFHIYVHAGQTPSAEAWAEAVRSLAANDTGPYADQWKAHQGWWQGFWDRSWIKLAGEETAHIQQGYALQRYISACAGRGAFPIKFNGSLFTVDTELDGEPVDADYRRWGGPYWFQNTRLAYWPMLAAGDYEMMRPLFRMYTEVLPFAKFRTQHYFGHEGAFFPETMYFWGGYAMDNYGWERPEDLPAGVTVNRYIRYHYDGALELCAMMLAHYQHTGDSKMLADWSLPLADAVLTFYDEHYPRDTAGRLHITPSQALETWWDVDNPAPVVAGLRRVLDDLLALSIEVTGEARRERWRELREELPPIPTETRNGKRVIAPAENLPEKMSNSEVPELYPVFPHELYGVARGKLDLAKNTFELRRNKGNSGWRQDEIWAAHLGLAEEAARMLSHRFATKHADNRFPAFWGPNYDWIPDQDHGCAGMIALQRMLLQETNGKILLFPAWPRHWDVDFKLHAGQNTTVRAVWRNDTLEQLDVSPPERRKDVQMLLQ